MKFLSTRLIAIFSLLALSSTSGWAEEKAKFSSTPAEIRVSLNRAILAIEKAHGSSYEGEAFNRELNTLSGNDLAGHLALQRKALLANPSLDFSDILFIQRTLGANARFEGTNKLGFPDGNYSSLANSQRKNWQTQITRLKNVFSANTSAEKVYSPAHGGLLTDMDLHFNGDRLIFAMARPRDFTYRLHEMTLGQTEPQIIGPDDGKDVDHFDPCYLPDGGLILASTATFLGMPCINGGPRMASLYRMESDRKTLRQLGFDQDTSWYPTLLPDGRVMYSRWDYSDMVHSNNRPLLSLNPDGSGQKSLSFSNSYFPTSFFFARPIPGHSSQIVGIITGHHGTTRAGRMILTDPAISEYEAEGMVQEIPGYGIKVKRKVADRLIDGDWPLLIHPYPLAQSKTHLGGGEFFLVSMKPTPKSLWGIYLVDIYDNAVLLWEAEQEACFEPIPLKKHPAPPIIPSVLTPDSDKATLYIQNIYHGPGLKDVPKGTVKQLRIGSYQFSANGNGGHFGTIGVDSGWDIKTIIGVAPVNPDGSVTVQIPAKIPLFFQPLDDQGRLIQGMRSWATAQGGERMSCVGCHEPAKDMPRPESTQASRQKPLPLAPWLGAERPMSFSHEIQPILDAKCISCHDGQPANGRYASTRPEFLASIPDLRATPVTDYSNRISGSADKSYGGKFTESYMTLHSLVRHPGIESPMAVLNATEFGSSVSELSQILKKGHYGVELSGEEWLKLYTWMDYNAPFHGYRRNIVDVPTYQKGKTTVETAFKRGNELSRRYANKDNFTHLEAPELSKISPAPASDQKGRQEKVSTGRKEFAVRINEHKLETLKIDLGKSQFIELTRLPSGSFTMGSGNETLQEMPMHTVEIASPFFMATKEISNAQLRAFDPSHDSQFEDRLGYQFGQECIPVNGDELPAVRVSWDKAMAFCEWLSKKSGRKVRLPSEAQWEWAARAGSGKSFWFGNNPVDYSKFANLADKSIELFAECTADKHYSNIRKIPNPNRHEMWLPYDKTVDDGQWIQCPPGKYTPNPWGLYDMHGNVAEWTRSEFQPYPFTVQVKNLNQEKVVRGGSYRDRPYRATSSYRLSYLAWQKVHDVGFRIIIEE